MSNPNVFIANVAASRKRTGVMYCSGSFLPIIKQFQELIPGVKLFDCVDLFKNSITFSATDLLNAIENETKNNPTIVANIETYIISNPNSYMEQLAKLLTIREPLKPLFFIFYSKKIFRKFRDQFESENLTHKNTIEF